LFTNLENGDRAKAMKRLRVPTFEENVILSQSCINFKALLSIAMHSVSFEDPTMPRPSLMRQNAFAKSLCDSLDTFSIQQQQQKQQEQQNDQAMLK